MPVLRIEVLALFAGVALALGYGGAKGRKQWLPLRFRSWGTIGVF